MTDTEEQSNSTTQKSRIPFKAEYPFNVRKNECDRICQKYIDRIPVIVEKQGLDSTSASAESTKKVSKSKEVPALDKRKYLVPQSLTIGQFVYIIRKRIDLPPERAIFVFVNNGILPNTSSLMSQLYLEYKDPDGFLYINYAGENTFGQSVFEVSHKKK